MFNLLGSFFFGRSSEQPTTVNNETQTSQLLEESASSAVPQSIDTQSNASDSTTTTTTTAKSFEDALQMHQLMVTSQTMDCELHKQWVIVERAKQQLQQQQQQTQTTTTHLDDVKEEEEVTSPVEEEEEAQVVISSEQDEVEMKEVEDEDEEASPKRLLNEEEDDDVLLGSFFDRNETDYSSNCVQQEERSQQPAVQPARQDEWLITPLPCLTSITCSQRSLVDNDPLENLLIEHPSMSVFVTVTSSAMAESAVTPTKLSQESAVFKVFSENVEKKVEEKKESSLGKSVSQRKRKGMETTTTTTTTTTSPSPTSTMRRKANKRNKKSPVSLASPVAASPVAATVPVVTSGQQQQSPSSSSNNKENMQVRTLLSSEFRSKANPASKLDSILLGKNQMKRNNKHANKFNSNNSIQRKFHKLQQPVCC